MTLEDWFTKPGAYVLVDGQFGSTGKGLMAGYIADRFGTGVDYRRQGYDMVTTNAGPNSGHTAYFRQATPKSVETGNPEDDEFEKIVTQQLPIAGVFSAKYGHPVPMILNAGAVIDCDILNTEYLKYGGKVYIHPCAALIDPVHATLDKETVAKVASTGKGVGPAMASKIMRLDKDCVASFKYLPVLPEGRASWDNFYDWSKDRVFVETAQGYSLGINSSRFYPHTTSRECTVMQAIADARIPAQMVRKVVACYRTYPIRVGNTSTGYSGGCYEDQEETTWEALDLKPEITTVTGRVRRVFTWSRTQFRESLASNRPDAIFLNFINYIKGPAQIDFIEQAIDDYCRVMGRKPEDVLLGYGPRSSNVVPFVL